MKKVFFFLIFLFFPSFVFAKDVLLEELQIHNGEISLAFDPYNTEYTVTLEDDVFTLDLDYRVEEGTTVAVNNNFDLANDSVVTISVTKENKQLDYHLHILKIENDMATFATPKKEENQNFMFTYKQYIIPACWLVLVIFCYKIIFHKRKSKKKII